MPFPRLFAIAAAVLSLASAAHAGPSIGYQHLTMADPSGPPVEVGVWYPADAAPSPHRLELFEQSVAEDAPVAGHDLPLVVISHGNGGSFAGHYDTATALARAGYVVAALTHTGDNYRDQSRAVDLPNRPRQLKLLVDYMLTRWSQHAAIDPERVGAFGFSSGGFTVLTAAGGEADLGSIGPHCRAHPDFYDCQLVKRMPPMATALQQAKPIWIHDTRLKAVVVAAPALGFAFGKPGLAQIRAPMQLWRAEFDHVLPQPDYAEAVRQALPSPPDYRVVAGADHYDFLSPCSSALKQQAPDICTSRPGFDREAFHTDFDAAVVRFFDRHLKR
jgi:predicted dienelactone hydrolase